MSQLDLWHASLKNTILVGLGVGWSILLPLLCTCRIIINKYICDLKYDGIKSLDRAFTKIICVDLIIFPPKSSPPSCMIKEKKNYRLNGYQSIN